MRSFSWLSDGGEAGELARNTDWSRTALGPVASWPLSLKTTVATLLRSRHPMFLWWGPELTQIYNDAYIPSFGRGKHPAAMGQRGQDCWVEIWPIIFPQIDDVMTRGVASWNEDHLVPVWRNGRIEEVYWTYGYSPVLDDGGAIGGTLVVCTETTARVLAERRLSTLRALAKATASATSTEQVIAATSQALSAARIDTPFAVLYGWDASGAHATRLHSEGLDADALAAVDRVCLPAIVGAGRTVLDLGPAVMAGGALPGGSWPEPSSSAYVAPLRDGSRTGPAASLVFGLSPRLTFDDAYRTYLEQLAEHVSLALDRIGQYRERERTAAERDTLLLRAPVATALFRGPEHVFELANERYCQMVGRSGLVGKTYREAFPELVGTALPGVLDRVYHTGEPFFVGELLVPLDKQGDGTVVDSFFSFNLEALRDANGAVYGMMAVAVEITEQVAARRVLERAQVERESILRDLEVASRTKDEFLAMLGHELRNPLAPIVTALQLLKDRQDGELSREQAVIDRQVAHLVRLVDDLLDVSKITRGKVTLRRESVEIGDVVAKAVEMASDLFEQRRHHLTIDVPADGARVNGDPVRLAQVVANLLTNAARYTDPGGAIAVRAWSSGDEVFILVKDNGVGIAADMLPRVFDLFVQGQRSTDRAEGGLGLGLALARSLVAMHGGTLVARSAGPGAGSEFEVVLPATSLPSLAPRSALEKARATRPKRVLVVDDSVDAAEMLQEVLSSAGHVVSIAHDGPSALALAAAFDPDVALLDIGLPVMDGHELAMRLRALPGTSRCRLIALTGYGQSSDRARSKAAGFEAHVVKPVVIAELLKEIGTEPPEATSPAP